MKKIIGVASLCLLMLFFLASCSGQMGSSKLCAVTFVVESEVVWKVQAKKNEQSILSVIKEQDNADFTVEQGKIVYAKDTIRCNEWFTDVELSSTISFTAMISNDVILYGRYEDSSARRTISYYVDDLLVKQTNIEKGKILEAAEYRATNLIITGWYLDSQLQIPYSFTTGVYEDLRLYAKYQEKELISLEPTLRMRDGANYKTNQLYQFQEIDYRSLEIKLSFAGQSQAEIIYGNDANVQIYTDQFDNKVCGTTTITVECFGMSKVLRIEILRRLVVDIQQSEDAMIDFFDEIDENYIKIDLIYNYGENECISIIEARNRDYIVTYTDETEPTYTVSTSDDEIHCTIQINLHSETTKDGFQYEFRGNFYFISGYTNSDEKYLNLPSTHEGIKIVGISDSAFANTKIKHIKIPNTFTTIGDSAFSGCSDLMKISYEPSEKVYIGKNAFSGCIALESVSFLEKISGSSVAEGAFYGCQSLAELKLPSTIQTIKQQAFQGCLRLEYINLDDVMTIEELAFEGCENLDQVCFSSVVSFGDFAFKNTGLTTLQVTSVIQSLGQNVFNGCKKLVDVLVELEDCSLKDLFGATIPTSIKKVSFKKCFEGCLGNLINIEALYCIDMNGLTLGQLFDLDVNESTYVVQQHDGTYSIPKSLSSVVATNMPSYAFANMVYLKNAQLKIKDILPEYVLYGCTSLTDVKIQSDAYVVEASAFESCSALKDISLDGALRLGARAFMDCKSLSSISLGLLNEIGSEAFKNTAQEAIELPYSVAVIDDYAFANTPLKSFTIPSSLKELGSGVFEDCMDLEEFLYSSEIYFSDSGILYMNSTLSKKLEYTLVKVPAGYPKTPSIIQNTRNIDESAFSNTTHTKIRMDVYGLDVPSILTALADTTITSIGLSNALAGQYSKELFAQNGITLQFDNILISTPIVFMVNEKEELIEVMQHNEVDISDYFLGIDASQLCFANLAGDPIRYEVNRDVGHLVLDVEEDTIVVVSVAKSYTLTVLKYPDEAKQNLITKTFTLQAFEQIDYPILEVEHRTFKGYSLVSSTLTDLPYYMPLKNITVTANWEGNDFAISFDTVGGHKIDSLQIQCDTKLSLPTPVKEGYEFVEWMMEGEKAPDYMPTKDIHVTAKWRICSYSIQFSFPVAGYQLDSITLEYNELIPTLEILEDRTHKFLGYYTDSYYKTPFNYQRMPSKNLTLYARYDMISVGLSSNTFDSSFSVKYVLNGGTSTDISKIKLNVYQNKTPFKVTVYAGEIFLSDVKGLISSSNNSVVVYAICDGIESEYKTIRLPEGYYISDQSSFEMLYNNQYEAYYLTKNLEVSSNSKYLNESTFTKRFYGNGYTLTMKSALQSQFYINIDKANTAGVLFGTNTGVIQDLNFMCVEVMSYSVTTKRSDNHAGTYTVRAGVLVGTNNGTISNVTIGQSQKHIRITCDRNNSMAGGVTGQNKGVIKNCIIYLQSYSTGDFGGISGQNYSTIDKCSVEGYIGMFLSNDNGAKSVRSWGGIAGYASSAACKITNCYTNVNFTFSGYNSMYHNTYFYWFQTKHKNCETNPHVGATVGSIDSSAIVQGNTFSNTTRRLSITCSLCEGSNGMKKAFTSHGGQVGYIHP